MAIIYSYPRLTTTAATSDLLLITDIDDSNKTKSIEISKLPFTNNAGTVTSIGVSMPSAFAVANSPITSSGTIAITTTGGSSGQYLAYDGTWGTPAGGASNAAGADTQVQYNDGGTSFGAGAFFTTNKSSKVDIAYELGLKGDGGSNQGLLKLYCEAGTAHHVGIKGPNHTGGSPASYTIQLPNSLPSVANQILESNASGTLSWIATPTGGGTSYQAGDGIDIDTSTNPDTLKTGLAANGGLVFDTAKMKVDLSASAIAGTLAVGDGGTGITSYAAGDLLYAETTTTLGALNISTNDKILGINNGATAPQWITNLVGPEVPSGYMLIGNGTSALTQLDTTAKGTIVVGSGSATVAKAVGTDTYVLTAKSADATGVSWEAITFPTVSLTSGVSGSLPVANGGTGLTSVSASGITRGNGTSGLVADSYLTYNSSTYSLGIRGSGNNAPSLSCTLAINDAQGPSGKAACIGLTPTGSQGAKGVHVDLGAYNEGIQIDRNNALASTAMRFNQTVSGSSTVGSITMSNTATAFNTSSDYRLKENVVEMTGSVDRVKQLLPKRFNFTNDTENTVDGFLAHEAQAVVPESVTGAKDEVDTDGNAVYQGIDQSKLVPLLVGAIKELTARIEALEA